MTSSSDQRKKEEFKPEKKEEEYYAKKLNKWIDKVSAQVILDAKLHSGLLPEHPVLKAPKKEISMYMADVRPFIASVIEKVVKNARKAADKEKNITQYSAVFAKALHDELSYQFFVDQESHLSHEENRHNNNFIENYIAHVMEPLFLALGVEKQLVQKQDKSSSGNITPYLELVYEENNLLKLLQQHIAFYKNHLVEENWKKGSDPKIVRKLGVLGQMEEILNNKDIKDTKDKAIAIQRLLASPETSTQKYDPQTKITAADLLKERRRTGPAFLDKKHSLGELFVVKIESICQQARLLQHSSHM